MTGLLTYITYGILILGILGGLFGILAGIYCAVHGEKHRGWESPWSLIAPDVFSLLATSLLLKAFSEGRLDWFWTTVLAGLIGLPSMLYVVWNDHKHAQLTGERGLFP